MSLLMVGWITFSVLAAPLAEALSMWALVGSNLLAPVAMGGYLLKRHPALWNTVEAQEA